MEKIIFDYTNGEISINNKIIRLTVIEDDIVKILIKNKNKYIRKEIIIKQAGLYEDYNLSLSICRLRKKLNGMLEIESRYGYGYRIKLDSEDKQGEEVYEI